MTISCPRRHLLKLATGLPLALPVAGLGAVSELRSLARYRVHRQHTGAGLVGSTLILVDTGITAFAGDGYYLYPDWGKPVVYDVRAIEGHLAFHYPGASQPLWTMAVTEMALFSGRVEALVDDRTLTSMAHLPDLTLPALPIG